jgi:hypothetical protein
MTSADIQTLHDLRRKVCTCNKPFLFPPYHEPDCPYFTQGDKFLEATERAYQKRLEVNAP